MLRREELIAQLVGFEQLHDQLNTEIISRVKLRREGHDRISPPPQYGV